MKKIIRSIFGSKTQPQPAIPVNSPKAHTPSKNRLKEELVTADRSTVELVTADRSKVELVTAAVYRSASSSEKEIFLTALLCNQIEKMSEKNFQRVVECVEERLMS